jgi:chromosome segregation ATPase
MGCSQGRVDVEMRALVTEMSAMTETRSLLQYRINQLNYFNEAHKAYPDITEVTDAQIELIRLTKEVKDTENLLQSIRGSNDDEHIQALEDTYLKLKTLLEEREAEASQLEAQVSEQANNYDQLQAYLDRLQDESQQLQREINDFRQSDNYRILKQMKEKEDEFERNLVENEVKRQELLKGKNQLLVRKATLRKRNEVPEIFVSEIPEMGTPGQIPRLRIATIPSELSFVNKSGTK